MQRTATSRARDEASRRRPHPAQPGQREPKRGNEQRDGHRNACRQSPITVHETTSAARDARAAARWEPRPDPSQGAEAAARSELRRADRSGARADRYPGEGAQPVAAARASRCRSAGSCDVAFHRAGPSGPSSSPKDISSVPPGRFERAPVSSSILSSARPSRDCLQPDSTSRLSGSYSLGVRRVVSSFGAVGAPLCPLLRVDVVAPPERCCLEPCPVAPAFLPRRARFDPAALAADARACVRVLFICAIESSLVV